MISKKVKFIKQNSTWTDERLDALVNGILAGDRTSLARGITLVESRRPDQILIATRLLVKLSKTALSAKCIAITGPPGSGKSTFIESMGKLALAEGYHVAVLSIDPSSELTGGSILGDKTRMPMLASHEHAFVRPSPSSGDLGGISRNSWEVKKLCEAAGYNFIFIETVGVGQSESEVSHLVDMMTVLLQPGSGDDLQSIKKGLNEQADFFVVNKADGSQLDLAREAKSVMLATAKLGKAKPVVLHSYQSSELAAICWKAMLACFDSLIHDKLIETRRSEQSLYWFNKKSEQMMLEMLTSDEFYKNANEKVESEIKSGITNVYQAVQDFLTTLKKEYLDK